MIESSAYRLLQTIAKSELLAGGDRVLVAVSGGPDSVALLHLLHALRERLAIHLEVAHLQHGIRGAAAADDAGFVCQLAADLEVPFHLKEVNIPQLKTVAGKGNLEALARAERYRFFAELAGARQLTKVATAHTLDDQAETVLMWLLRGAGMTGLGGMAPWLDVRLADSVKNLTIIRPLLEVAKSEILDYLQQNKISYRVDDSNLDPAYLRNWLRLELLPKLRERVDDHLAQRLGQHAELMRNEDLWLEKIAAEKLEAMRDSGGIRRDLLTREPLALQRRVLRRWISEARGTLKGLSFIHLAEILRLCQSASPHNRFALPGGWEFACDYEGLILTKIRRSSARACYNYQLTVGKILRVPEAGVEIGSEKSASITPPLPNSLTEAVFDAAFLTGPLIVRNFRNGDRYRPLGMLGHKKVKDLFIDEKIPLGIRAVLPMLTMADVVLWIPGYARSELGKVLPATQSVVHFKTAPIAV